MKKQLLCTSAIALGVAAASPALAQEWDVRVGGYYVLHVGVGDNGGSAFDYGENNGLENTLNPGTSGLFGQDYDGLDLAQDAEVHVIPRVTLDNGLTFGANIQFETADGSDMDEVYVQISGDQLGTIQLGFENSAGAQSMVAAPNVGGMPIQSPSTSAFVPWDTAGFDGDAGFGFLTATTSPFTEVAGNSDVARLTYFTPSFNGFTLGLSYAPDNQGTDGQNQKPDRNSNGTTTPGTNAPDTSLPSSDPNVITDIFDIGINYEQTFGTTDIAFGARWGTGSINSLLNVGTQAAPQFVQQSDPETWGVSGSVGFNGWTIGAWYAENDSGIQGGLLDSQGVGFGISYDIPGPWAVSFTGLLGEVDGTARVVDTDGTVLLETFGDHDREAYILSANRTLGPGVDWSVWVFYEDFTADAGSPLAVTQTGRTDRQYDIDGTVLGTSIALSF